MATPTIIQEKTQVLDTAVEDHSIAFDDPPAQGNWVFIFIHVRGGIGEGDVDVTTPSSGVTTIANGAASGIGKLWRFKVTGDQEQTYVIDHNVGDTNEAGSFAAIVEVNGADATDPVDVTAVDVDNTEVTTLTVGDLVTTVANALLIVFVGVRAGGADASFVSDPTSFLFTDARDDLSGAAGQPSGGGWGPRAVTVTGTYNSIVTWTDAGRCVGIAVAIKEAEDITDIGHGPVGTTSWAMGRRFSAMAY